MCIRDSSWDDIQVPGNWEVQGHGIAIYTNHGYEFKPRNPQPPALPEANPVGVYRRDIEDVYKRQDEKFPYFGRNTDSVDMLELYEESAIEAVSYTHL